VLVLLRDPEIRKDQDDDEDVVDRERVLDQVARDELEGLLRTAPPVDEAGEAQRERDPDAAPDRGLLYRNLVRFLVEDAEIQG